MFCSLYVRLFGNSSRPIQTLNIIVLVGWLMSLATVVTPFVDVATPVGIEHRLETLLTLSFLALLSQVLGFYSKGERGLAFQTAGLLLAGIFHAIISTSYALDYPPLNILAVVQGIFTLLFTCTGFFCYYCEGKYVDCGRKR